MTPPAPLAPRVGVVMPFRDAAATIDDALASLAAQTLADFECVLVDHGSTDGSAARARAIARRDARFRVLPADGSFAAALNRGVAAARAPLIARFDADDLAHPRRLERQCALLASDPTLSLASCLVECFPAADVQPGMHRYLAWSNALRTSDAIRNALFVESPLVHPSVVMRRSALDAVGGYREFDGPEDYDLWLRLLLAGHRAAKVAEILLSWRESPRRLSRVDPRCRRRGFLLTKLHHFPTAVPPGTPLQIWGAGITGRSWARHLQSAGYEVRRFIDIVPRRWGRIIRGAEVHPPHAPDRRHGFLLAAAGALGARECLEDWLAQCGLQPWDNYLAVT